MMRQEFGLPLDEISEILLQHRCHAGVKEGAVSPVKLSKITAARAELVFREVEHKISAAPIADLR